MRVILVRRSKQQAGFTLIELMTVLIIIAIMSAMILPEMRGTYEDAILRSSSRNLISLFNMASSRAVAANQIHRVRFDLSSGHYWIECCVKETASEMEFATVPGDSDAQGTIDSRVTLSILKKEDMPEEQTDLTVSSDDTQTDSTNSENSVAMDAPAPQKQFASGLNNSKLDGNSMDSSMNEDGEENTDAEDEDSELEDPTECIVMFYPDGTAESKVMILEDHSGFRRAFQINPYTSRVQVFDAGRRL